jgi:hypothetical protein
MLPNLQPAGHGLIVWDQPKFSLPKSVPIPDLNSVDSYCRVESELLRANSQVGIIVDPKL